MHIFVETHNFIPLDDLENELSDEGAQTGNGLRGERTFKIPYTKLEHTQRSFESPPRAHTCHNVRSWCSCHGHYP